MTHTIARAPYLSDTSNRAKERSSIHQKRDQSRGKKIIKKQKRGNISIRNDQVPFFKRGRVDQWLTSDIFGLEQPRSLSAEQLIELANKLQLDENAPKEQIQEIHNQLVKVLAPDDEFWPLWTYFAQTRGVQSLQHA